MDVDDRRRYLDVKNKVKGRAEFYSLLGWGHDPCTETGIEMKSGDLYLLLSSLASFGLKYGIHQTGGSLQAVGMRFGEAVQSPIAGGYQSGQYGYFGKEADKAELIGIIKKKDTALKADFVNDAGAKVRISHTMHHDGY
jgi:hypothetical protein